MGMFDNLVNYVTTGKGNSNPEPKNPGGFRELIATAVQNNGGDAQAVRDSWKSPAQPNDAASKAGQAAETTTDTRGRGNRSYLREAVQDGQNQNPVTWENFQSKLQQAQDQYTNYFDTFQNHYGVRQDLTEDDQRRLDRAGITLYNNKDFGNSLEDWKTYGEGQERQIKAQTADLRKFLDDNADKLDQNATGEIRSILDQMDDYSGQLWRAAYNDEGIRARDNFKQTGNAYTVAEKAYNEAQQKLREAIANERSQNSMSNTPASKEATDAVEQARQEARAAEDALQKARSAYETAGGLGRSYSDTDRVASTVQGAVKDYGSSLAGVGRVAAEFGAAKSPEEQRKALGQYEKDLETARRAYDEALRANRGDTSAEQVILAKRDLDAATAARDAQEARITGEAEALQRFADRAQGTYDRLAGASAMDIARAKNGASDLTRFLVDAGVAGTEMLGDAAIGAATMGALSPKTMMALRVFGKSAQEAKEGGGDIDQQILYGGGAALLEVATESMFDGLAGLYGAGGADEVVEKVIGRLAKNPAVRNAMRMGFGAAGEAAEEVVSGLVSPYLRTIYSGELSKEKAEDVLYDALVGGFLGLAGGGVGMANGQYAQANAQIDLNNAMNQAGVSTRSQAQNAMDVLSGRATPEQMAQRESSAQATLAENMGGTDALSQYINDQRLGNYQNVQAAEQTTPMQQLARQAVAEVLANGRVNNTTVNEILNNPELRAAAEYQTGLSFEGMTTEQARSALQRAARQGAYTTAQFNAQEARAAEAETARAQAALEEEAVRNNANNYDSYIRGILKTGADTQTANEILNDPTLKEIWERMTGKTLPENRKSAVKMLRETTRANVDIDVDSAIERYINERNAPPQTAEIAPQTQDVSTGEITQAETQTGATEASQELNFNPTPEAEAQTAETVTAPTAEAPAPAPAPTAQTSSAETQTTGERGYTGPRVHTQDRVFETNLTEEERAMEGFTEEEARHIRHSDEEVDRRAKARLENMEQARAELLGAESWTDEDVATAGYLIQAEMAAADSAQSEAERTAAYKRLAELKKQWNRQGTEEGRALRQRRRFVAEEAVSEAANLLYTERGGNEKQLRKLTPQGKDNIMRQVRALANQYNNLPAGDSAALINLIKEMSNVRRTTGLGTTRAMTKSIDYALNQVAQQNGGMEFLREVAATQIKSVASDYLDPGIINKLSAWRFMSMLSNAATPVANLGSNFIFGSFMESMTSNFASPVDMLMSLYTGRRTVTTEANAISPTKWKGSWDGFLRSFIEVTLDAESEQAKYGYNEIKGRTFKMTGNPIERMLSLMERNQGYLLKSTDQAAKGGTEAVIRKGLGRLGTDAGSIDELATDAAKYRTLQQESKIANTTAKVRNAIDEAVHIGDERTGKYGLATDIMPFAQVPANAVKATLDAQPAVAVTKAALNTVKAIDTMLRGGEITATEQANISRSWGRVANSAAVVAAFMAMAARGHLRNYDDDDRDVAVQNRYEGKSGTQLNISSLFRDITGGDRFERENDKWIDFSWVPMLNALANFSVDVYDSYADGDRGKDLLLDGVNASWNSMVDSFLEFPAVSKISDMISTFKNSEAETGFGKAIETGVTGISQTASGIMVPNAVRSVAAGIDPYERDTTTTDSYMETIGRNLIGGIPFARQTLPEKLDNFGNPVVNNGGALNFFDRALIPGNVSRHDKQSDASRLIGGLIEQTGDTSLMPDRYPPKSIKIDGEKTELTAEERRAFKRDYGSMVADMVNALAEDPTFLNSSQEEQAAVINEIEAYAKDRAKAGATEAHGGTYSSDWDDEAQLRNPAEYLAAKAVIQSKEPDYSHMDDVFRNWSSYSSDTQDALKKLSGVNNMRFAYDVLGMGTEQYNKVKSDVAKYEAEGLEGETKGAADAAVISKHFNGTDAEKIAALESQNLPGKQTGKRAAIVRRFEAAQERGIPFDTWAQIEGYIQDNAKNPGSPNNSILYEAANAFGYDSWIGKYVWRKDSSDEDYVTLFNDYFSQDYVPKERADYGAYFGTSTEQAQPQSPATPTVDQMYGSYNALLEQLGYR